MAAQAPTPTASRLAPQPLGSLQNPRCSMKWGKTTAHQAQSPRAPRCPWGDPAAFLGVGQAPAVCLLSDPGTTARPGLYSFHSLPQRPPPPTLGREFQQTHSNKEVAT